MRFQMTAADARARINAGLVPVSLSAVAAALSWWIAHSALGHPQPFFAPIAAAVTLSTSRVQRSRRIVQLVVGVLLGIVVGELLTSALGPGTLSLAVVVLATLSLAVLAGAGFIGDGMMFANQAVASAILVSTLRKHGAGAERAVDALVGGVVALVLGVGLFPAEPLSILGGAERSVLIVLARRLRALGALLDAGERPDDQWTIDAGFELQGELARFERARATARGNVRIAPRRWRLRALIAGENARAAHIHLLAAAILGLVRAAGRFGRYDDPPGPELPAHLRMLAEPLELLAGAPYPWPAEVREQVSAMAHRQCERAGSDEDQGLSAGMLTAAARDLELLVMDPS